MAFSVNTNNESMAALRLLNQTNRGLSQVQDRINSGFKVNGARDNASTFSIAQGMRGDVAALKAINEGLSMGIATTQVAVDAATQVSNKLIDLQAEVMKAQESTADRTKIQENIDKMVDDIQSIVDAAQFNGYNLLNGTDSDLVVTSSYNRTDPTTAAKATTTIGAENLTTGTLSLAGLNVTSDTGTLTFGASWNANLADAQTLAITANGVTTTFEIVDSATDTLTAAGNVAVVMDYTATQGENAAVLMQAMRDQGFSVGYNDQGQVTISSSDGNVTAVTYSTADATGATVAGGSAATALTTVSAAMTTVNESLSRLAATANQLESQQDFVKSLADTLTSGVGALVDADLAEESARLQALQTKQQLGIQALSIANQGPGAVLSLFR